MKKLLLLVALSAFLITLNAQKTYILTAKDPAGSWLHESNLGAVDTIGSADSTWTYTIYPNKGERLYYDIALNIDSVGGTGGVAGLVPVILQGRRLSSDTYTNIDTITWIGSASDTTIKFSQVSTAQFYTEYRLSVTAANNSFKALFDWIKARFWY